MTRPSALPAGAGAIPALAAVATPKANTVLKTIDRTIVCSFPIIDAAYCNGRRVIKTTDAMNDG
jgi:hypothetical protein